MAWSTGGKIYTLNTRHFPMPDLIVSVEAPFETCVMRIKERDRVAEREIDLRWLGTVYDRYQTWLADFSEIPVVTVDSEALDYIGTPEHGAEAVRTIRRALERTGAPV